MLYKRPFEVRADRPYISFSFDDFPQSALRTGGAILKKRNLAGTYYVSFGLMDKDIASGRMFDQTDLARALAEGHELGCHTFSHADSGETPTRVFEQSLLDNQRAFRGFDPKLEFHTFSYPISTPRPRNKMQAGRRFSCCRGGGQTFNEGLIDLNCVSAFFLEKSRGDLESIKDLIDRNRQKHGWLVFATHDVAEDPTPYGCTPAFFEEVVQYACDSGACILPLDRALKALRVPPERRRLVAGLSTELAPTQPLVSILIPAYNSEQWIGDTVRSALAQTWVRKEIIIVDDGSTDRTLAIAKEFESTQVRVVSQKNSGAAAARNTAYGLSSGAYIQWLDADDLLSPDKIALQMASLDPTASKRVLLSSAWARFIFRPSRAAFNPSKLWRNLSPTEWLLLKLGNNLYMQTATWLVSRELSDAAGSWNTELMGDDDGEYFCRVLLASEGTRFVPDARVYYRGPGVAFGGSLSYIWQSEKKLDAHWRSMELHVRYLRSLEDSERVRLACLAYIHTGLINFYPERKSILKEAAILAESLGEPLKRPTLQGKYRFVEPVFGWQSAIWLLTLLRKIRWKMQMRWDKLCYFFEKKFSPALDPVTGAIRRVHPGPPELF